jgi:hypothetical protein
LNGIQSGHVKHWHTLAHDHPLQSASLGDTVT